MARVTKVEIDELRINKACECYFKWKDLNSSLLSYATRGINFPDAISEPMGCYALDLWWNKGSAGDAISKIDNRNIEMKATSNYNSDLSSFGPRAHFDNLVFLRLNYVEDILDVYDLGINSEQLKLIRVSANESIGDQQLAGKRPRISIIHSIINAQNLQPTARLDIRRAQIIDINL